MSLAFTRALAGAGSGASAIASKYIDEQLAQQRAQVLADIQFNSAKRLDEYTNDPTRRAGLREQAGQDTLSQAGFVDQARMATLGNTQLTDAEIAQKNAVLEGTGPAAAKQAGLMARAAAENQAHDVAPGGEVIIGTGKNNTPTAAQIAHEDWRDGLRSKKGEDRDRAYEAMTKSIGDQLKEKQTSIDKFLAENPGAMQAPQGETHWYGDSPAKPNPAYDNYQRLLREKAMLTKQQNEVIQEWRSEKLTGSREMGGSSSGSMRAQPGDTEKATIWQKAADDIAARVADANGDPEKLDRARRDLDELTQEARKQGVSLRTGNAAAAPAAAPNPADPAGIFTKKAAAAPAPLMAQAQTRMETMTTPTAVSSSAEIPEPPPKVIEQNGRKINNPAFPEWLRVYGDAYAAKQMREGQAAAMSAFSSRAAPRF
jgi:hypothetical protein